MNHGLKVQDNKLFITLGTKDGWRPDQVIVDGKIYKPVGHGEYVGVAWDDEEPTYDFCPNCGLDMRNCKC